MRAAVKHSHGHCKGYIRSGSSHEGPFLFWHFGMQNFHNDNHSELYTHIQYIDIIKENCFYIEEGR